MPSSVRRGPRLRGKDIRAGLLTPAMLEVVIQGAACLVQHIDVTKLLALVSDMQPANLRANIDMFHEQVRNIAHAASRPVLQGEVCFAAKARPLSPGAGTGRTAGPGSVRGEPIPVAF